MFDNGKTEAPDSFNNNIIGTLSRRQAAVLEETHLFGEGCSAFWGPPHYGLYAGFIAIGVGSLLLAGLWTPVAGALQAIIEAWITFGRGGTPSMHLLLAALGVSLVMLGPGAWSLDARLFGRKRIDIRSC
jgi:uncharacterized membrane protein YphA (DoxX/SURF4 family)